MKIEPVPDYANYHTAGSHPYFQCFDYLLPLIMLAAEMRFRFVSNRASDKIKLSVIVLFVISDQSNLFKIMYCLSFGSFFIKAVAVTLILYFSACVDQTQSVPVLLALPVSEM